MQHGLGWSRAWIQSTVTVAFLSWGACSPVVGRLLSRYRGRPVITGGALLGGAGFLLWALWPASKPVFLVAWTLVGAAMRMALYASAFAMLVRAAHDHYKAAITALTLVGGFASTLFMPLVQMAIDVWNWKSAIFVMDGVNLLVCAPLHAWGLPIRLARESASRDASDEMPGRKKLLDGGLFREPDFKLRVFAGLALWFTLFQGATAASRFCSCPCSPRAAYPCPPSCCAWPPSAPCRWPDRHCCSAGSAPSARQPSGR